MAEFTIQFEADSGVDVDALAEKLKGELAAVPTVDTVQAEVMESRDLALAATTIMACLTMAPKVIDDATKIVNSLKALVQASQGLKSAVVDIRGRRVPIANLQPSDLGAPAGAAGS
ncbi:MAG TPA: hypothetical protein VGJ21_24745 [Terracidiphilus sp.]|jgi:prophage DNA circulation protein